MLDLSKFSGARSGFDFRPEIEPVRVRFFANQPVINRLAILKNA
jgi:hypothetical protein